MAIAVRRAEVRPCAQRAVVVRVFAFARAASLPNTQYPQPGQCGVAGVSRWLGWGRYAAQREQAPSPLGASCQAKCFRAPRCFYSERACSRWGA